MLCAPADLPLFFSSGLLPLGGAGKYRPKSTAIVRPEEHDPGNQSFVPFHQRFLNAERKENIREFIWTIYVTEKCLGSLPTDCCLVGMW